MFNEALCEIYDPRSIGELRKLAAKFESEGRHVCVCDPASSVPGQVFPVFVGIEDLKSSDCDVVYQSHLVVTEGRPFIPEDTEVMMAMDYEGTKEVYGKEALELWVK